MTRTRRTLLVVPLLLAPAVALAFGGVAAGSVAASTGAVKVSAPTRVSGPDPLPPVSDPKHCGSARGGQSDRHGWEAETAMVIDPSSPDHVMTAWIQDWSDAITTAHSGDGGGSWNVVVAPSSICTPGGDADFENGATDPWLATDSAGTTYLSAFVTGSNFNVTSLIVDTSTDNGHSWSSPVHLDTQTFPSYVDGSQVVVDPQQAGHAYVVWRAGNEAATTRSQYMSSTTDSGRTWTSPASIPSAGMVLGGRLAVMPDGSLVDVYVAFANQPGAGIAYCPSGPTTLYATQYSATLQTWSAPVPVNMADTQHLSVPSITTSGSKILATWQQVDPTTGHMRVLLATWSLGDAAWSAAQVVADEPGQPEYGGDTGTGVAGATTQSTCPVILAAPAVAVAPDGTIGVLYYDHRGDPTGNPARVADLWVATLPSGGATWSDTLVAGPFDQSTAPSTGGATSGGLGFLGDYQTLLPAPHGFVAAYVLAHQLPGANFHLDDSDPTAMQTDVFFSRIRTS